MAYNPNEPRDSQGRWTNGGATAADRYAQAFYPGHPTDSELATAAKRNERPTATAQKKRVAIDHGDGRVEIRKDGSRSWRNNNPGNIVAGQTARDHGAIGSDGTFAIFPDEATGTSAMEAVIKEKYGNSTIDGTIAGWAPPSDHNDTPRYQKDVQRITGLPGNTPIKSLTPEQIKRVGEAIRKVERWDPGTTATGQK